MCYSSSENLNKGGVFMYSWEIQFDSGMVQMREGFSSREEAYTDVYNWLQYFRKIDNTEIPDTIVIKQVIEGGDI